MLQPVTTGVGPGRGEVARSEANGHPDGRSARCERIERRLDPDVIRCGSQSDEDPASLYASPADVVRDEALSHRQKNDLLRRWALKACTIEQSAAATGATASRIDDVIDALLDLEEAEAAPARHRGPRAAEAGYRRHRGVGMSGHSHHPGNDRSLQYRGEDQINGRHA